MTQEILRYLPLLAAAVCANILLGCYKNIGVNEMKFDFKIFVCGIAKAAVIAISFVLIALCFDNIDLGDMALNPTLIMNSAIIIYVGKATVNLAAIFGINKDGKVDESTMQEGLIVDENGSSFIVPVTEVQEDCDGGDR